MTHPAWLLLSAVALAQLSPPADIADQTIVVTGTKPSRNAVARYVEAITAESDGHIARFRDPICPASFGLPDAYNRVIEQRLRDDAVRVGLRAAAEHCDANVVLIVADDPGPLLKTLQSKRPQMFVGISFEEIQEFLRVEEPVRAWQAIEPRGSDGRPLQRVMFVGTRPVGGDGALVNAAPSNSRIEQSIQADLVSSFVLIASEAVDGLTLSQIADYAAMRSLAKTRSSVGAGGLTILRLFDGNPVSARTGELTSWDVAYLRSLYLTDNRIAAHSQEAAISAGIRRTLDEPQP